MSEKKKRNLIICSLCGVLLLMAVGYAAFNTILTINGTASITSNWDIKITNITEGTKVGDASSAEEPTYEDLTATFSTNLVSPGDSIEYDVTIENKGSLDAQLNKIILPSGNNDAIRISTSGLTVGDDLNASGTATLTVKVEYDSNVTSQPKNKAASFEIKLDYVQKGASEVEPQTVLSMKGVEVPIVTENDGLYEDPIELGRYVYKGTNPNNYITFNGESGGWRIIAIEADGTIKIMRNSAVIKKAFDSVGLRTDGYCSKENSVIYGCNVWAKSSYYISANGSYKGEVTKDSEMKEYLNETYYNSLTANKTAIENHPWYYGSPSFASKDLNAMINEEKKISTSSNVGLIQASDYIKSNTNTDLCETFNLVRTNYASCKSTTWMIQTALYWTLSPHGSATGDVLFVDPSGALGTTHAYANGGAVVPVIYLKSDTELEGEDSTSIPYKITNYME